MDTDTSIEDEAIRRLMGTTAFGKQDKTSNIQAQIDQTRRKIKTGDKAQIESGQEQKVSAGGASEVVERDEDEDGDEEDEDEEDEDEDDEFPVTHEVVLKTHDRPVTSLSLDISGSRLASGSMDCTFKLHDFASMTATTLRAFRSVDPTSTKSSVASETHPVHQVLFNPLAPSQLLVITAHPQAKLFNRDGEELVEFIKGDMYLRDLHNTKGHVSEITSAAWNPDQKDQCATAGTDGTLRIWDINNKRTQKDVIVFKSKVAGSAGRTRMTAIAWSSQAQGGSNLLISAALDGSLVMYAANQSYSRPAGEIHSAHTRDTWTSGIALDNLGRTIVTRGGDDTIKLWDTRKFKSPISTACHPSTSSVYPTSNISYCPTSANIITGSDTGHVHILNPATLRAELVTPVTPGSPVISVLWHPKLNQILTGSADGSTHILYSPNTSSNGAKLIVSRAPKRRHIDDNPALTVDLSSGFSGDAILPGHSQPMPGASFAARHPTIGLTASGKSRDPRRPHMPAQTPFANNAPTEKHILESVPLSSMRDEDPRQALLKYADMAKQDPIFTTAWHQTQPKTIYANLVAGDQDDDIDAAEASRSARKKVKT